MTAADRPVARVLDLVDPAREARRQRTVCVRAVDLALAAHPLPLRVLDVGSGPGDLARELEERLPTVLEIVGLEPSAEMIAEARRRTGGLPRFMQGRPEHLPFLDGHFDLVLSVLSYAGWADQQKGLAEVGRVLAPGGLLVLAEARGAVDESLIRGAGLRVEQRQAVLRSWGRSAVTAFIVRR